MEGFLNLSAKTDVAGPTPNAQFPSDLFTIGNAPYIVFQKRDPTNAHSASTDNKTAKAISLYMPPEIEVNYGAHWEDIQMTIFQYGDIVSGDGTALVKAIDNFGPNTDNNKKSALAVIKSGIRSASSVLDYAAGTTFQPQADQIMKRTPNPHMAMMFKGVEFRTFRFTFQMMARNKDDSDSIKEIIKSFKAGMHPSVDEGSSRFWVYPDSFKITLSVPNPTDLSTGGPSPYLFQITNAVLENMSVNYAGSGIPSFFGETGAPVDIRMTLQFKELSELTREQIIEGF